MHILVITPAGKRVKIDVGDEADPKDVNNDKLITPEEPKLQDLYPSTSIPAQPQEISIPEEEQKLPTRFS